MKKIEMKYVYWGIGALVSMAALYLVTVVLIPQSMVTLTKAAPAKKVDLANSYVLGSKLLAKADGVDKCRVNVFVLDERSQGVAGKSVYVEGRESLTAGNMALTDSSGKASFEFVSEEEGVFEIKANVEGVELGKGVKITFRRD